MTADVIDEGENRIPNQMISLVFHEQRHIERSSKAQITRIGNVPCIVQQFCSARIVKSKSLIQLKQTQ